MIQRNISLRELRFFLASRKWDLGRILPYSSGLFQGFLYDNQGNEVGYYLTDFIHMSFDVYSYDQLAYERSLEEAFVFCGTL